TEPRPVQHFLQAGPLSAIYANGSLRYIRLGDQEVVRMIYFALRDEHWNTLPARVINEHFNVIERSFQLTFDCVHYQDDTDIIRWHCVLTGDETGCIRFSIDGTVVHPFNRNRAGLCVLHPISETVGQAVRLTHPDGAESTDVFPELISPHQPFIDIAAMQCQLPDGTEATLTFEGDIFETEDQRNWSDTSFKTYCTPLHLPRPVLLQPGDQIRQVVTLDLTPSRPVGPPSTILPSSRPPGPLSTLLPPLGLCHAIDQPKLKTDEAAQLRRMGLNHLRISVDFSRPDWSEWLTVGLSEAKRLQVQVVLAIIFTDQYQIELNHFQQAIEWLNPTVSAVDVFHADQPVLPDALGAQVTAPLKKLFAGAKLGLGSLDNFTELNRNRPGHKPANTTPPDYLVYALNPQTHAIDDQTVIENLAAQTDTFITARSFAGDLPIHVGPVTLKSRHTAEADPRYSSLLAAGWLVGSLAALTRAGASGITYFDTKGPKGVMEGIDPETNVGQVFPTGLVLMALADWQEAECIPSETYNSLTVSSLSLKKDHRKLIIMANHTWDEQTVSLPEDLELPAQGWFLDETTAPISMQTGEIPAFEPLSHRIFRLNPFAVVGILADRN
ncbi:MAG: hypothetical protein LH609_09380, partial [Rudanella sp.]|nr:hypothetical protein [Rudanella sp.]